MGDQWGGEGTGGLAARRPPAPNAAHSSNTIKRRPHPRTNPPKPLRPPGKTSRITITNDKGRLTKDEIERMVQARAPFRRRRRL